MGIFVFMYVALLAMYLAANNTSLKNKKVVTLLCFLVLWLIQGLRHESIGIDSCNAYRPFFDRILVSWSDLFDIKDPPLGFEKGFYLYARFIKLVVGTNTQLFVLLSSFISLAPISYLIYKHSNDVVLSHIVFASFIIYYFGFSGMRQAMAIGIITLGIEMLIQKKKIKFLLLVFLASQIHTSALMFVIAYPLSCLKINKKTYIYLFGLSIFVLMVLKQIALFFISMLFGEEKYVSYITDTVPSYNLMILLIVIFLSSLVSNDTLVARLRPILFISILFQSLGIISTTATRIGYYFYIVMMLTIPLTISGLRYNEGKLWKGITICLMMAFFFYCNSSGYLDVVPYKFFWE